MYLTSCLEFVLFTEAVTAFSWEPGGSKFAIIHGESPRISASFYNMEKQGSVSLLSKYTLDISLWKSATTVLLILVGNYDWYHQKELKYHH